MFLLGTDSGGYKTALENGLGGVIFFTPDIQSVEQFKTLVKNIKARAKIPPFLAIDQEGGRVERTENIHGGKKYLCAKLAYEKGKEFLQNQTEKIARELKGYGLNLNFAPCVDVNTNPDNPVIGERAFSDRPEDVTSGGLLSVETYLQNGIIPCIKHFPGHGDAAADSHLTLPLIDKTLGEMQPHIEPFRQIIKKFNGSAVQPMVMIAHLHCAAFDKEKIPSSQSKNTVSYLRNELGFDGVIVSDDMLMKGACGIENACEKSMRAGVNLFIYRGSRPETVQIIESLAEKAGFDRELRSCIEKSYEKIIKMKECCIGE
jgi:beta-N-acetylhexosaminidase